MQITNIAAYKFIPLSELSTLRVAFLDKCLALGLKGTILLGAEGLNLNLAGTQKNIAEFKAWIQESSHFADMSYRESLSATQPFRYMKVKIKKEIITMRRPEVCAEQQRAPSIAPRELKQWLDERRDITILDTRNAYEVRFGTFENATHFGIDDFSEFPEAVKELKPEKPVVMFCTGGIRCEKAALHLQNAGFPEVYQLDGGILNYFSEVGGAHYDGECFVFDQRVSVDAQLQETGTLQCRVCHGPVSIAQQALPEYISGVSCHACSHKKVS